ncbi:hypothetical protein [Cetobacterium sp.]|uniref:hypothetical protein n=1 Tax=Cetobacterium sp. TaxID=2071632 RepID=UPI0025C13612|nr:hypothetical protein [Cetobacterium sp.]
MTKEEVRQKLLEMKEQYIFEITGEKAKKKTYSKLYFLKLNDNRYLACDVLAGFVIGTIIEENYMTLEKTLEMIQGYLDEGYILVGISNPKFPKVIK